MILFINACVRKDSRTKKLADYLLSKTEEPIEEVRLWKIDFPVVDESFISHRDSLILNKQFNDPMFSLARQFAEADKIVIAAPFWDLSFPSVLKQYFEQINVLGITFNYSEKGIPIGLCKASKLYYVTTAGGFYFPEEYGFGYVKDSAKNFYGISETELIKAVGLDVVTADEEKIMSDCMKGIKCL